MPTTIPGPSLAVLRESPALRQAIAQAAGHSAAALAEMTGRDIAAGPTDIAWVPLSHITMVAGDPERVVIAIYLGVGDDARGHILLALGERMALTLVDLLLDQPTGTTSELDELGVSALAEVGNVAGTFFLNTLADGSKTTLPPTPPVVLQEMCGAILDTLAAQLALAEADEAMVVETQFACDGETVELAFFLFPAPDMLREVGAGLLEVGHAGHAG